MPLATAAVLFPVNGTTVDTAAAIDIRLLASAQTASAQAQSVTNSSQGTTSERTFDPANTGVTVVASALVFQGEGWALRLAEDSTPVDDTNCNAVVRGGTRTVNLSGTVAVTGTVNVGASHSLLPRASLWRYNPTTDTAVLVVGGSGTAVTATAAGAFTASVSLVLAQPVELLQGEVLLLQIGGLVGAAAGLLGGATSCTWTLNANVAGTNLTFGQGHLAQVCSLTGSSSGSAAATASTARVLPAAGAAGGTSATAGALGATKQATGTVTASAAAQGALGAVKGTTGAAAGTATATGRPAVVVTTTGTVLVSSGTGGGAAPVTDDEIARIAAAAANSVWDELTSETRAAGSYGVLVRTNLDGTVSSRATGTAVGALAAQVQALLDRLTSARAAALDLLDVAVSTRTPSSVWTGARAALLDLLPSRASQDSVDTLGAPAQAVRLDQVAVDVLALTGTRASQTSVDGLGDPVQTDDPRLDQIGAPDPGGSEPDRTYYDGGLS